MEGQALSDEYIDAIPCRMEENLCNNNNNNNNHIHPALMDQDPKDLEGAQMLIEELRTKCRMQAEHIMKWKKAYAIQIQQHYRYQKEKNEQMNSLTSQLLLLESRLKRKQKQIAGIICQRELTILRQQKLIDALSSRLVDHGLDTLDPSYTDFDSLNDSDSAVVLEDIDSDCNSSFILRRKSSGSDVTIVRSISDAIETNLNKYSGARRTNCYLRRPDILETVYSVEEDPEPSPADVAEKRDKFKNRSDKAIRDQSLEAQLSDGGVGSDQDHKSKENLISHEVIENSRQAQVTNFNRIMSNHRSVTKPKDVKYKRINKAKSKSLEELRGRLKHWVEKGTIADSATLSVNENLHQTAQSYA